MTTKPIKHINDFLLLIFPEFIERNNSAGLYDTARHERIGRPTIVLFFRQNPVHMFSSQM